MEDLAVPEHPRRLARGRPTRAGRRAARGPRAAVSGTAGSLVLVGAAELLAATPRPVLLDVRWALGDDRGHEQSLEGHLPGAVFVDLDAELAGPPSPAAG